MSLWLDDMIAVALTLTVMKLTRFKVQGLFVTCIVQNGGQRKNIIYNIYTLGERNDNYKNEVSYLAQWSKNNNLSLNVEKTKEIVIDFRRGYSQHSVHQTAEQLNSALRPTNSTCTVTHSHTSYFHIFNAADCLWHFTATMCTTAAVVDCNLSMYDSQAALFIYLFYSYLALVHYYTQI